MLSIGNIRQAALATTTMAFEKFEMMRAYIRELLKTSKDMSLQSTYQQLWTLPALLLATAAQYVHADISQEDTLSQQAWKVTLVVFEKFCDVLDVHFNADDTSIQRCQKIATALSVTISSKVNDFFHYTAVEELEDEKDDEELATTTIETAENESKSVEHEEDLPKKADVTEQDLEEALSDEENA